MVFLTEGGLPDPGTAAGTWLGVVTTALIVGGQVVSVLHARNVKSAAEKAEKEAASAKLVASATQQAVGATNGQGSVVHIVERIENKLDTMDRRMTRVEGRVFGEYQVEEG